jgi:hypothetical protein
MKYGPQAGQSAVIPPGKIEYSVTTGLGASGQSGFTIEQSGSSYLINPFKSALIYLNGDELAAPHPLKDGDEIAVPPEVVYVFHRSPTFEAGSSPSLQSPAGFHRPGGVTFVAILQFLAALAGIVAGLIVVSDGANNGIGLLALITGVASLVTGIGLWQMREWGRVGTILIRGVDFLYGLTSPGIGLAVDAIIVIYLLQGSTASHFKR